MFGDPPGSGHRVQDARHVEAWYRSAQPFGGKQPDAALPLIFPPAGAISDYGVPAQLREQRIAVARDEVAQAGSDCRVLALPLPPAASPSIKQHQHGVAGSASGDRQQTPLNGQLSRHSDNGKPLSRAAFLTTAAGV
ncbi:hypothetical protein D3C86_1796050 [compost metagenome]